MRTLAGRDGAVLIGFDLLKSRARLHAAYNDTAGVTARFNLNLLAHVNRVLGADFDLDGFEHRAPFDEDRSRIEMHLVSRMPQTVHVGRRAFHFEKGEVIVTEYSHKYTPEAFAELAATAGLEAVTEWRDAEGLFCVQLLEASAARDA
jgi:L-histidine N-alpha-methyltransferase